MADKKIIWKQKTGASTFDILYPKTLAEQVVYNGSTVADALDNIGTNLEGKYVTLDTEQEITAKKDFTSGITVNGTDSGGILLDDGGNDVPETKIGNWGIERTFADWDASVLINFPTKSGTLLVNGDIPNLSRTIGGSGNAVTDITVSGHSITVTKGATFASTATATQSANGLMSSTDKKNLDDMVTLFGTTAGDTDTIVNTVRELLSIFNQYPEGTTITQALALKADKSALSDYVTLATEQSISGAKTIRKRSAVGTITPASGGLFVQNASGDGISEVGYDGYAIYNAATIGESTKKTEYTSDAIICSTRAASGSVVQTSWLSMKYSLPTGVSGTIALTSDIPTIPSSLPPTGAAGGDLTGTYPNPTIGSLKVTEGKIAAGAVTEGKIGTNAVTTGKIKDGNVTNAKLDTTGIAAGTYSVLTINAQGRATAGALLFTVGTATTIPASVPTNGFYLQEVA